MLKKKFDHREYLIIFLFSLIIIIFVIGFLTSDYYNEQDDFFYEKITLEIEETLSNELCDENNLHFCETKQDCENANGQWIIENDLGYCI